MTRRRLRPFLGMPLAAEDLLCDQDYHRAAARRHQVQCHGWGILEGLACQALPGGDALAIARGSAVTPRGDLVDLPDGVELPVERDGFAPGEEVRLVLRAVDAPDPRTSVAPFGGGAPEPARVDEGVVLRLRAAGDPSDADEIELGRFRIDAAGRVAGSEVDTRRRDGWRAPSRWDAGPAREAVDRLAEALKDLPGVLPPTGRAGAWLGSLAASAQMVLLAGTVRPEEAAAVAARLLGAAETFLAAEAPAEIAAALAEVVRGALAELHGDEGRDGPSRDDWARRWIPRVTRAASAASAEGGVPSVPRPAFKELSRTFLAPGETGRRP